jgi:hypothetical protein
MNLFDLTGKTAIVTGGKHGNLGPLWVETLARCGAWISTLPMTGYLQKCSLKKDL